MAALIPWFLLLHILGAIGAFGPTFAFPIIGAMAAKEPQARPFVARMTLRLVTVMVIPLALSMAVTGSLLIWATGIDLTTTRWLQIAIVVYVIAIVVSLGIGYPNTKAIAALASAPPPPGASGPPPELPGRVKRAQRLGMLQTVLILTIATLMVVKPRF